MPAQRVLIFANGSLPDLPAARALIHPGDFLLGVDGGSRHLARLGLRPHLLVGDLDSLSPQEVAELATAGVEVLRYPPEKDETDLELAIEIALRRGFRELVIVAALGGRVDQALANIFLLSLPGLEGVSARLDDGLDEVFLIRSRATLEGRAGEIVSLLPLGAPAHGITTQGLRYPLRGETLFPERSRGISNELLAEQAEISLVEGVLVCIHTRSVPPRPGAE